MFALGGITQAMSTQEEFTITLRLVKPEGKLSKNSYFELTPSII